MTTSQILGFVGTGLVIVGYIPQIVHLVKERCTAGISIPAFSLWCAASILFLIHAAMIGDAVFVGVQIVNLVAGGLIVWFCKKYKGEVCPFHRETYSSLGKNGAHAVTFRSQ
ncbi:MAG: SemiSWEET family sugar transporter [Bryobacteraceae bacterium]